MDKYEVRLNSKKVLKIESKISKYQRKIKKLEGIKEYEVWLKD